MKKKIYQEIVRVYTYYYEDSQKIIQKEIDERSPQMYVQQIDYVNKSSSNGDCQVFILFRSQTEEDEK